MQSRQLAHTLLEQAPEGILGLDADGRISLVNDQLLRCFGYDSDEELLGRPVEVLLPERLRERHVIHRRAYDARPHARRMGTILGCCGRRRDGSEFPVDVSLSPIDGVSAVRTLAIVRDATEQRREHERLSHLADHDDLTGLLNRRAFMRELGEHLDASRRYGGSGSLLMLDLDHFKRVNDRSGHRAGDRALSAVAAAVRGRLRRTDRAGRIGGDEFAVLLPHASLDDAHAVASSLADAVRGGPGEITVSIGIVALDPACTADAALAAADAALYSAKAAGRDRITTGAASGDSDAS